MATGNTQVWLSVLSSLETNGGATFPVDSGWCQLVPRPTVFRAARGLYGLWHVDMYQRMPGQMFQANVSPLTANIMSELNAVNPFQALLLILLIR